MAQSETLIFVVDDEKIISYTLATILEQSGFVAISFDNPVKALDAARLQAPDFLLSDVMMSPLNGFQLANQIQKLAPCCKVVLFSGQSATTELMEKADQEKQVFALLPKPFHPTDLLALLRTLSAYPSANGKRQ